MALVLLGQAFSKITPNETATASPVYRWIVQSVCVDSNDNVIAEDPFICRSKYETRPLRIGENLPYHKLYQPYIDNTLPLVGGRYTRRDSYPTRNMNGDTLIVHTIDIGAASAGASDPAYENSGNGYDTEIVKDGFVSIPETFDGSNFGTTWWGAKLDENKKTSCVPYNGWRLFPESAITTAATAISGRYDDLFTVFANWEKQGLNDRPAGQIPGSTPGNCDESSYNNPPKEDGYLRGGNGITWHWIENFPYGGALVGDSVLNRRPNAPKGTRLTPLKPLQTLISVDGSHLAADKKSFDPDFLAVGHLEVFFYNNIYGRTRWDSWLPWQRLFSENYPYSSTTPLNITVASDSQLVTALHSAIRCTGVPLAQNPDLIFKRVSVNATVKNGANSTLLSGDIMTVQYTPVHGTTLAALQKVPFIVTACADFSGIEVLKKSEPPLAWNLPEINLLRNFHFQESPALDSWIFTGSFSHQPHVSQAPADLPQLGKITAPGVPYLGIDMNCGKSDCTSAQAMYQELDASALADGKYAVGLRLKANLPGARISVGLRQLDNKGLIIEGTDQSFNVAVPVENPSFDASTREDSVVRRSTKFIQTIDFRKDPRTQKVRYVVHFGLPGQRLSSYKIVEAYLFAVADENPLANHDFSNGLTFWQASSDSFQQRLSSQRADPQSLENSIRQRLAGAGTPYLLIDCVTAACPKDAALVQDIPVAMMNDDDKTFSFGAQIGVRDGKGHIVLELTQLDANKKELSTVPLIIERDVPASNTGPHLLVGSSQNLRSYYDHQVITGAKFLRFKIIPKSASKFEILETYLKF